MRYAAAMGAVLLGACASGPAPEPQARGTRLRSPSEIGPMVITGIVLPPAGTAIGGHYQGTGHTERLQTYQLTEQARTRWSLEGRTRGERIMRLAGYLVESIGPSSSDARRLVGIDYGLSGNVTSLVVASTGTGQPYLVETQVEVAWELLDFSSGAVVFGRSVRGGARLTGPVDSSVAGAMDESLQRLLADSAFRRALSLPRGAGGPESSRGYRALPEAGRPISLSTADLNPSPDSGAQARVAWGVASLHGPGGGYFGSLFVLTRDGLALTTDQAMRTARHGRDARARLSSGVERPLRVVRSNRGLNVALVQVQCPGDCPTVDWRAFPSAQPGLAVVIIGSTGDSLIVSQGVMGGRWGLASGVTLQAQGAAPGEPIATPGIGRVFAMVAGIPGRQGAALMLAEIFRELNLEVEEALRR